MHSGKINAWEEAMALDFKFCPNPNVDRLAQGSPAPVSADAKGRYPAPIPGAGPRFEHRGDTGPAEAPSGDISKIVSPPNLGCLRV